MGLAENKATALRFLEALKERDADRIRNSIDDDANLWIIGSLPFSGYHRKPEYMVLIESMIDVIDGPLTIHVEDITAEENRVSITGTGEMKTSSGKPYNNSYHFFFEMRNGLIIRSREYVDTALVMGMSEVLRDEEA